MAKAPFLTFQTEEQYEAAIEERLAAALSVNTALTAELSDIKTEHARDIEVVRKTHEAVIFGLKAELAAARTTKPPKPDEYAAFSAYPDLCGLMQATDLRVNGMPALCALEAWKGAKTASAICKAIPITPKGARGGNAPTTKAVVARSLHVAAAAFLEANRGVGIKILPIKNSNGDCEVRIFRFTPIVEIVEKPAAADAGEPQAMDEAA